MCFYRSIEIIIIIKVEFIISMRFTLVDFISCSSSFILVNFIIEITYLAIV
jgi:hypothetical protein